MFRQGLQVLKRETCLVSVRWQSVALRGSHESQTPFPGSFLFPRKMCFNSSFLQNPQPPREKCLPWLAFSWFGVLFFSSDHAFSFPSCHLPLDTLGHIIFFLFLYSKIPLLIAYLFLVCLFTGFDRAGIVGKWVRRVMWGWGQIPSFYSS